MRKGQEKMEDRNKKARGFRVTVTETVHLDRHLLNGSDG